MSAVEEEIPARKIGRPINPERHRPDGSYYKGPNDKDYFKKYYHEKLRKEMTCEMCKQTIKLGSYNKHVLSMRCLRVRNAEPPKV